MRGISTTAECALGGIRTRDRGSGRVVPVQTLPAAGSYRLGRPVEAYELAPGLENTPQRRVSLESNERNFLSLLLYHGSLALRHAPSRSALERLLEAGLPVFLDVNLRPPWCDPGMVVELLKGAHWVKLNHDELKELESEGETLEGRAQVFLQRHGLESIFLTKGKEGAVALSRDGGRFEVRPGAAKQVVDTVGAGDAFASVLIFGLLQDWSLSRTLERAQAFASSMVRVRGATVNDMAFYHSHLEAWGLTEKAVDHE